MNPSADIMQRAKRERTSGCSFIGNECIIGRMGKEMLNYFTTNSF